MTILILIVIICSILYNVCYKRCQADGNLTCYLALNKSSEFCPGVTNITKQLWLHKLAGKAQLFYLCVFFFHQAVWNMKSFKKVLLICTKPTKCTVFLLKMSISAEFNSRIPTDKNARCFFLPHSKKKTKP